MEKEEIAVKELTREQLEQIRKAAFLDADFLREKRKDSRNQED